MNNVYTDPAAKNKINNLLSRQKKMIRLSLFVCVHCSICSDSCFLFRAHKNDPAYTPSYKAINSIGKIFKTKGDLPDKEYKDIADLVWNKCVMCTRCYCPIGISIPSLIAMARNICREKGFYRTYDEKEVS
jgi:Fe-S oxidoreductase